MIDEAVYELLTTDIGAEQRPPDLLLHKKHLSCTL